MFMSLKPQDIVVLLKLLEYESDERPSYSKMSEELFMSQSEVHSAVKRLQNSNLLHGKELNERPNLTAIEEFLICGLKYAFPAEKGSLVRGMPTSYAAKPLSEFIQTGDDPIPVWADPNGEVRGIEIKPLYRSVPKAAGQDSRLYECLALIDAIRAGKARERKLAEKELRKRLKTDG